MSDAKGKTMKDEAPERIWARYSDGVSPYDGLRGLIVDDKPGPRLQEYVRRADPAPEVTEEMVERAALAIFKAWYGDEEGWASVWHLARPGHMEQARAALTAALATQEAPND